MAADNSWEGVSLHAKRMGAKFPELVAAQWAIESGFGKYFSGKWNAFGLKGSGSSATTKEFYDGQWVTIKAGFIDFPSLAASIEYLVSRWYLDWKKHKGVNHAPRREAAARMLQSEGYATDPAYAEKLIRLMNQYAPTVMTTPPSAPIELANAALYYRQLAHQRDAWQWLQGTMSPETMAEFAKRYRSNPQPAIPNPLAVPYFSQRDNLSGQGYRECFSSSCAMIAAFYGKVKTDDEYNLIRARFGDTTNSSAQLKTLQHLGLKPTFRQNLVLADIEREIKAGFPIATGWLHQGNYRRPTGGGHWSVVVGLSNGGTIHMDPFGEPDLVRGGHFGPQGGKYATFSNQYWLPRWEVKGGDGWGVIVRP
jgi:hypothetical protein